MKLDKKHLSKEIKKILDADSLSPDELADLSGVNRSTIYAILDDENPRRTTQRAIGRKIATGTNRRHNIDGDKIYFSERINALPEKFPDFDFENLSTNDKERIELIAFLDRYFFNESLTPETKYFLDLILKTTSGQRRAISTILEQLNDLRIE